jgi:hypothetical protein
MVVLTSLCPQQLLDRSDVVTAFKQMGGEGMAKRVNKMFTDSANSPGISIDGFPGFFPEV